MSDPIPAPAEQNTDPAGDSGEAQGGAATETDNKAYAELRILRKQLKEAQQRLSAADQAAAEKAKAEMSELERYKSEAETYRKQLEDQQSRFLETQKHHAFKLAAQAAGAVDVDAAIKLADLSTVDLDGDQVIGVDAALKALKKSKPYLFGTPAAAAPSGGNPSSGPPSIGAKDIPTDPVKFKEFAARVARGEIKLS